MTIQDVRRDSSRRHRVKNPEAEREYQRQYRLKNIDRIKAQKAAHSKRRYQDKGVEIREFYRHHHLKKAYGMTMGDLQRMLIAQEFRCAICQSGIDEFTRAIDHCHERKQVRGLLCRNCNTAIGLLKDNPFIAIAVVRYLNK